MPVPCCDIVLGQLSPAVVRWFIARHCSPIVYCSIHNRLVVLDTPSHLVSSLNLSNNLLHGLFQLLRLAPSIGTCGLRMHEQGIADCSTGWDVFLFLCRPMHLELDQHCCICTCKADSVSWTHTSVTKMQASFKWRSIYKPLQAAACLPEKSAVAFAWLANTVVLF